MKLLTSLPVTKTITTVTLALFVIAGCQKDIKDHGNKTKQKNENGSGIHGQASEHGHLQQAKTFSSQVVIQWLNMQLNMLRVPLAGGAVAPDAARALAYCGVALYEAVEPGMPAYQTLSGQLNGLQGIPSTEPGRAYHWAASANAALAYMCRHLYPLASPANKTAMDDLETQLQNEYGSETTSETLNRSIAFGRAVATIVFNWSEGDGFATLPNPNTYQIEVGPGLWEKTPPNFAGPANPFASQRRLIVSNSGAGTTLAGPPPYSPDPTSSFFAMVKDVYDRSLSLSPADSATALYHRDAPGYPGGGSLVAILSQAFQQSGCMLDDAALAYAKLGIASHDALLNCFVKKYIVKLVRPITYIRDVMHHAGWNALFPTPGHPEFPSAHATNGGAISVMLTDVLGENFQLTLDHYSYLVPSLPARHYHSFDELGRELGDSRVLAGIHYQTSCDQGFWLGKKIAGNILNQIKFKK